MANCLRSQRIRRTVAWNEPTSLWPLSQNVHHGKPFIFNANRFHVLIYSFPVILPGMHEVPAQRREGPWHTWRSQLVDKIGTRRAAQGAAKCHVCPLFIYLTLSLLTYLHFLVSFITLFHGNSAQQRVTATCWNVSCPTARVWLHYKFVGIFYMRGDQRQRVDRHSKSPHALSKATSPHLYFHRFYLPIFR